MHVGKLLESYKGLHLHFKFVQITFLILNGNEKLFFQNVTVFLG